MCMGGFFGLTTLMQGKKDLQDAVREGVDMRAPVEKQKPVKADHLEEELKVRGRGCDVAVVAVNEIKAL